MSGGYRGGRGRRGAGGPPERARPAPIPSAPRLRRLPAAQVQDNGYSEGWLRKGFPWVYRDEVVGGGEGRAPGEVVQLVSGEGQPLGAGLWGAEGKVAVRAWRSDAGPVDDALVHARLASARARRVLPPATSAWRWAHGENDDMPGVRVDVWGDELSIGLEDPSLEVLLPALVRSLRELAAPRAIWRADRPPPEGPEGAASPDRGRHGLLWGQPGGEEIEVVELGLRYGVRPGLRHDVGLFCDMRQVRAWLRPFLAGRRVLNLFAHTGAFSVLAAAEGATVTTVDLSSAFLERAQDNLRRNGLDPSLHAWAAEDSLAALDRLRRKGQQFDLVIADPPSFSHGPRGDWSVLQDLGRLVAGCCRVLSEQGWLLVASNHGGLSPKDFGRMVLQGSQKAEVPLRLLHEGCPPPDFPAALSFPESRYLKCWVLGR
ncbi:class I SAM-dependent rRNA methyltransferase [Myxococcota bacterium]|nr:class I SAM-dependent rRNA methyltransferase [Myxococcota bacterium]